MANFFEVMSPEEAAVATIKNPIDYGYKFEDIEEWGPIYVENGPVSLKRFIKEDSPNVDQKTNDMRMAFYQYIKSINNFEYIGKPYIIHPFSNETYNNASTNNKDLKFYSIKRWGNVNNPIVNQNNDIGSFYENNYTSNTSITHEPFTDDNIASEESKKSKQLFKQQIIMSNDRIYDKSLRCFYPFNYSYNIVKSDIDGHVQLILQNIPYTEVTNNFNTNVLNDDDILNPKLKIFKTLLFFTSFDNTNFYNPPTISYKLFDYRVQNIDQSNVINKPKYTYSHSDALTYINNLLDISDAVYPFPENREFIFPVGTNIPSTFPNQYYHHIVNNGASTLHSIGRIITFLEIPVGAVNYKVYGPVTIANLEYETLGDFKATL